MTDKKSDSTPIALEAYEKIAEGFSERAPAKAENAYIEQPAMRNAVGNVRGMKIFEAGCGPGILAEYLVHEGAKVVAFDVSPKMIELAKKRVPQNATFFVADMAKHLPVDQDGQFDMVVASLSIDYIENWAIPLSEFYRLLKPKGKFIFTIQHPIGSWNWYKPTSAFGVQYVEASWKGFTDEPVTMPDYYRSFSEVINPLITAGFKILKIEDLKPIDALRTLDPYKFGKYSKLATFMCVIVEKE
ncbi:class I SAM-dependent methyltransferase [Bacteriovorax sp. PP10]|uniref:Class I SAM-dependent methyltransferase n=1 Tax=Bacteriovorax antarcticus TaxID=3088717 RepID=A0ABU5VVH4_9BACT|nr:class I SAM-dependent methyltransferase [Bacteriovorax sp. PP10]MEA9357052.1 class I SAM-dependent methyltransferase [Bacteriovorax sp. PP10]